MKKTTKNSSKRKWIVGGVVAFAAVALLTTGFATWVVGVNQTDGNDEINITVDTVENQSIEFSFSLTEDSIMLAEEEEVSGDIVNVSAEDAIGDLQVTYSFTLTVGEEANFDPSSITLSLEEGVNEVDPSHEHLNTTIVGGDWTTRTEGEEPATYFVLATESESISLEGVTPTQNTNGSWTYESSGYIHFDWGTFFYGQSPATYYNSLTINEGYLSEAAEAITNELNEMYDALNGTDITLTAEVIE